MQCPFQVFLDLRYKKLVRHTSLKSGFYYIKKAKLGSGMISNIIFAVVVTLNNIMLDVTCIQAVHTRFIHLVLYILKKCEI